MAPALASLFRMEGKGGSQRVKRAGQQTGIFHSQEGFLLRTAQGGWVPVRVVTSSDPEIHRGMPPA